MLVSEDQGDRVIATIVHDSNMMEHQRIMRDQSAIEKLGQYKDPQELGGGDVQQLSSLQPHDDGSGVPMIPPGSKESRKQTNRDNENKDTTGYTNQVLQSPATDSFDRHCQPRTSSAIMRRYREDNANAAKNERSCPPDPNMHFTCIPMHNAPEGIHMDELRSHAVIGYSPSYPPPDASSTATDDASQWQYRFSPP